MDILNKILQEKRVQSTQIRISFRVSKIVEKYSSILVSILIQKRIPNKTKLVRILLHAKYATHGEKPSLTQPQLYEQSGKISARIRQHKYSTQNIIFGISHPR